MLLSRLGASTCVRKEFLKQASVTLIPRQSARFLNVRTFKSTAKLYQEELTNAVKVREEGKK